MTEPTYEDVAKWLPTDIREHIETSLPCRHGGPHDWGHDRTEFHTFGRLEPSYIAEHWRCRDCGLIATTDPERRA